jgi:hypothetical protein
MAIFGAKVVSRALARCRLRRVSFGDGTGCDNEGSNFNLKNEACNRLY